MKKTKRLLSLLLTLCLVLSLTGFAFASESLELGADSYKGKLVIIHTNDTHGRDVASEGSSIGTAGVAKLKAEYEAAGAEVLLISAGDAVQGTPLVNFENGKMAIEFMNAAGYDLMVPGNHEFDWGTENLLTILKDAKFPVLAANIIDNATNEALFDTYAIFESEVTGTKIGVFGLDTPETATKAHPDKVKGVTFLAEEAMFEAAQANVDELKKLGADVIVCVGHLGINDESKGNQSYDVIDNVTGIDLFIDGHSHTTFEKGEKRGDTLLVSTGEYLKNVGVVVYDKGEFTASLVSAADYSGVDADVAKIVNDYNAELTELLESEVIAKSEIDLDGARAPGVRTQETNLGDFAADSILWYARYELGQENVDAAITNGGGIRETIKAGDVNMNHMVTVFPFNNTVATVKVTGAQLLEALEAATWSTPDAIGAFPQVAGMSFTIDTTVPFAQGEQYPNSTYYAPANPGARIKDLKIGGVAVDLNKEYTIATNDFTAAGGDTYYVFSQATMYNTGLSLEDALIKYVAEALDGVISADMYGQAQGRIVQNPPVFVDVNTGDWFYEDVNAAVDLGLISGVSSTHFSPSGAFTRGMLATLLYRVEGEPDVTFEKKFSDVSDGVWFSDAITWAAENSLVTGYSDGTFAPNSPITREEMFTLLYRYAKYCGFKLDSSDDALKDFSDASNVSSYALDAVKWAVTAGLVNGEGGKIDPKATANRAQGAVLLLRFVETEFEYPEALAYEITEVSKYGNVTLNLAKADFIKEYAYGDVVTVTFQNGKSVDLPFVSNYSDVDNGAAAVLARESEDYVTMAVNMGNFATTYNVDVGSSVDIELKEAAGYYDEYLSRQVTRTDVRADYSSDEVFANFRNVTLGGMAEGVFYRSSSPVNPEIGRNTYADALAKEAGIKTFINLADTEDGLKEYEGYEDSYYKTVVDTGYIVGLNMGVDFSSADFRQKLRDGLTFMGQTEGPVLIHCNEGKDRAGFVSALLEALMGASLDEIVDDYMLTYENYYHVEHDSEQWNAIAKSNILATLASIAGVEKGSDLSKINFATAAEDYIKGLGLIDEQILAIKTLLGTPVTAQSLAA